MNKLSIAKTYIKNPLFLSLGSTLLISATSSALSLAGTHLLSSDVSSDTLVAATIAPCALYLISSFIYLIESDSTDNSTLAKIFNPLKQLTRSIVHNYIHTKSYHQLDDQSNFKNEEGMKRAIKHFFFNAFVTRYDYGSTNVSENLAIEPINDITKWQFCDFLYTQVLKQKNASSIIAETFKNFKKDALFSYSLNNCVYDSFEVASRKLRLMLEMNKLSPIITKKDTQVLKSIFKNNSMKDSVASYLFNNKYYPTLPKEFRSEMIKYVSANYLENNRARILEMESSLKDNFIGEVEKARQGQQLSQIQEKIVQEENKVNVEALDVANFELPQAIKKEFQATLESAEYLVQNMSYLSATQAIEFKNLINHILPKYIELFMAQDMKQEAQIEKMTQNLNLINQCFNVFKEDIQAQKNSSLEVYEQFLEQKIKSLRTQSEPEVEKAKLTLKSSN